MRIKDPDAGVVGNGGLGNTVYAAGAEDNGVVDANATDNNTINNTPTDGENRDNGSVITGCDGDGGMDDCCIDGMGYRQPGTWVAGVQTETQQVMVLGLGNTGGSSSYFFFLCYCPPL